MFILKSDTNKLIYKTEIDSQKENRFMVTKGKSGRDGGINYRFGINIHTLLYIKYINNKDLLCSTGNYIQ